MLRKQDLELLANTRRAEAGVLYDTQHYSGAYYVGGYAIELGLKACIAASFQPDTIPDRKFVDSIYTHSLPALVKLAGLEAERLEKTANDTAFAQHWEAVAGWSESTRYLLIEEERARLLVEALRDADHGVFEWIATYW